VFELSDSPATRDLWPHPFSLQYRVKLSADSLTTALTVENTGSSPFSAMGLLHTYYAVRNIHKAAVRGFEGKRYVDKVAQNPEPPVDSRPLADFTQEVRLRARC
jgi:glucose-6-phosphate 1-epimerase